MEADESEREMTQESLIEANGVPLPRLGEPVRADAARNRAHIIAVARDALAKSAGASLNSIAQQAGVGAGTLYRHFPTREALLLAVYRDEVQALAAAAPVLLAEHPPLPALRLWIGQLRRDGADGHGLSGAMRDVTSSGLAADGYGPVLGALATLLRAGEQAGVIRPGVRPDDLLLLLGFLWRIDDASDAGEDTSARMLGLVLDGLQAGIHATVPSPRRWFWRRAR